MRAHEGAHQAAATSVHLQQGRGTCQARNLCMRGCPLGGYFSSNSSTLPWAARTGRLTVRPHSVVHSVLVDERTGRATGVRVIDAVTHDVTEYRARVVFMNASEHLVEIAASLDPDNADIQKRLRAIEKVRAARAQNAEAPPDGDRAA